MSDTFEALEAEAIAFRDERDWEQFHNPKDLALGLQIEAAELAELFLWKDAAASQSVFEDVEQRPKLEAEIADVQIYLLYLARAANVSIPDAVRRKLESNAQKYPVEKARGSAVKYTDL